MNALVKKEIRLLLPGFLASLLMALAIWLLPNDLDHRSDFAKILDIFWFFSCPAVLAMLTLGTFGREFSSGTFSMLLAQPVPRARIWLVKVLPLAVMVVLVWFVWCISYTLHNPDNRSSSELRDFEIFTALFALAIYSGGLWSVLLFRQVAAGFWFAVLTPSALLMAIAYLLDNQPDKIVERVIITVFTVYGIAGYFFAHWLFLRAQDVGWTGGNIAMPQMRGLARFKIGSGARRDWRPRAALLLKEFQLHQGQFIMAGVLALLHLGVIATRKFGSFQKNSTTEIVLESFWMLWLVMPFLVGCAAVAEERKMGMLEGQLCLPVKRRTQFGLKVFAVIVLSVALGTVMPLLLEGTRVLPEYKLGLAWDLMHGKIAAPGVWGQFALNLLAAILFKLPLLTLVAFSIGMATIAFYASTLTRNTLQALAPAVLGILAAWLLILGAYLPGFFIHYPLWRGFLIYFIAVPVLAVVLAALAYGNYKRVLVGWNAWWKNLLTLAIALALAGSFTSAIYHRVWELLKPIEPPHGVARLTPGSTRLQVVYGGRIITIFLPDGRVWMNRYDIIYYENDWVSRQVMEDQTFGGGKFLDGTNWLDVADCWRDIIGIQRDGSLWVSEKPDQFPDMRQKGTMPRSESTKLARFGNENDWKSVSSLSFLLKTNGTLCVWGTNRPSGKKAWPGLHTFQPQQLGTNSDWAEMFTANYQTFFRKTDGELWSNRWESEQEENTKMVFNDQITLYRVSYLPTNYWRSLFWCNALDRLRMGDMSFQAGICEDGTFRELAHWQKISHSSKWRLAGRNIQIGTETNWLAATGGYDCNAFSLKADGTLWRWNFETVPDINSRGFSVKRFSEHSDWVAIGAMADGFVALAADGSLWFWHFEPGGYYRLGGIPPLLAKSRKPQYLGNVFGKAD
jgi:hypothetical protein